jgi:hypothetical protein
MLRSAVSKVMWVGRATVFLVGLAVILAVVFGVVSMAAAHTGVDTKLFHLEHSNTSNAITRLAGSVTGPILRLDNNSTGSGATALDLQVEAGKAPLTVNSTAGKATNLNADKLDGKEPLQLPGAVRTTKRFAGDLTPGISKEIFHSPNWGFDGPTVQVSTTSNQRLIGGANAVLGVTSGTGVSLKYGLCYRQATDPPNPVINFLGNNSASDVYSYGFATINLSTFVHAATVTPGAGTWDVGFCTTAVDGDGPDRNGGASGWVQVVNQ